MYKKAFLYPTLLCNLNCKTCYSRPSNSDYVYKSKDIASYKSLVNDLYEKGIREFDISGGEPFLYEDILGLVDLIKAFPDTSIDLVSNGTLLQKDINLAANVIERINHLFISLDGLTPESYGQIRSPKVLGEVLSMLDSFSLRYSEKIGINMVVIQENKNQIIPMLNYVKDHHLFKISFLRYIDVYRYEKEIGLDVEEFKKVYEQILSWVEAQDPGVKLEIEIGFPGYMMPKLSNHIRKRNDIKLTVLFDPIMGCNAFRNSIVVGPNFEVSGCTAFVSQPEMFCGNYLDDSDSWETEFSKKRELLKKREKIVGQMEPCCNCEYFRYCKGGCPSAALKRYGDIMHPDPSCIKLISRGKDLTDER